MVIGYPFSIITHDNKENANNRLQLKSISIFDNSLKMTRWVRRLVYLDRPGQLMHSICSVWRHWVFLANRPRTHKRSIILRNITKLRAEMENSRKKKNCGNHWRREGKAVGWWPWEMSRMRVNQSSLWSVQFQGTESFWSRRRVEPARHLLWLHR